MQIPKQSAIKKLKLKSRVQSQVEVQKQSAIKSWSSKTKCDKKLKSKKGARPKIEVQNKVHQKLKPQNKANPKVEAHNRTLPWEREAWKAGPTPWRQPRHPTRTCCAAFRCKYKLWTGLSPRILGCLIPTCVVYNSWLKVLLVQGCTYSNAIFLSHNKYMW